MSVPLLRPPNSGRKGPALPSLSIPNSPGGSPRIPPVVPPKIPLSDDRPASSPSVPSITGGSYCLEQSMPKLSLNTRVASQTTSGANTMAPASAQSDFSAESLNEELRKAVERDKHEDTGMQDMNQEEWAVIACEGEVEELGRLGEGIGGSVSKARLKGGKLIFALKTIPADPNPAVHRQILRELAINRHCHSEHIVKYYASYFNESSATISICMEYCSGGSLDTIYKRVKAMGGRIGENVLGKIAEGVLSGLNYLHCKKIIHRDIKPSNILLTREGQIKLCDFGVSGELVNSLAGTFTGTSSYMAPERIQGNPYTVKADVWSMGLTLMEVAQHRFPFFSNDQQGPLGPIELLTIICTMAVPELEDEPEVGIRWTQAFRHFLRICLERDTEKRPSPRQMLEHTWIKGHQKKNINMARFIAEVCKDEA